MDNKARMLEEIAANGHVALNTVQYDGWILKFTNGYTTRVNSVSVLYPSAKPFEEKLKYCEEMYARQGLPTSFKLTEYDTELTSQLKEHGYKILKETDVMELALENIDDDFDGESSADSGFQGCTFSFEPTEWLPYYFDYEGVTNEADRETFREMLTKVKIEAVYGSLMNDGKVVGSASLAIDQGYALLQNVVVTSELRGKGLGEKMCRAMIQKAKDQGAHHVFLQVVEDNGPAMNLYKKLGFEKLYTYWYMKK